MEGNPGDDRTRRGEVSGRSRTRLRRTDRISKILVRHGGAGRGRRQGGDLGRARKVRTRSWRRSSSWPRNKLLPERSTGAPAPFPHPAAAPRMRRRRPTDLKLAALFLLPSLLGLLTFLVGPMLASLLLSLTNW